MTVLTLMDGNFFFYPWRYFLDNNVNEKYCSYNVYQSLTSLGHLSEDTYNQSNRISEIYLTKITLTA